VVVVVHLFKEVELGVLAEPVEREVEVLVKVAPRQTQELLTLVAVVVAETTMVEDIQVVPALSF
jgi:hypothetical protein